MLYRCDVVQQVDCIAAMSVAKQREFENCNSPTAFTLLAPSSKLRITKPTKTIFFRLAQHIVIFTQSCYNLDLCDSSETPQQSKTHHTVKRQTKRAQGELDPQDWNQTPVEMWKGCKLDIFWHQHHQLFYYSCNDVHLRKLQSSRRDELLHWEASRRAQMIFRFFTVGESKSNQDNKVRHHSTDHNQLGQAPA